jgi:hypothetical protein
LISVATLKTVGADAVCGVGWAGIDGRPALDDSRAPADADAPAACAVEAAVADP